MANHIDWRAAQHAEVMALQHAEVMALQPDSEHLRRHSRRVREYARVSNERARHLVQRIDRAARRRRKQT